MMAEDSKTPPRIQVQFNLTAVIIFLVVVALVLLFRYQIQAADAERKAEAVRERGRDEEANRQYHARQEELQKQQREELEKVRQINAANQREVQRRRELAQEELKINAEASVRRVVAEKEILRLKYLDKQRDALKAEAEELKQRIASSEDAILLVEAQIKPIEPQIAQLDTNISSRKRTITGYQVKLELSQELKGGNSAITNWTSLIRNESQTIFELEQKRDKLQQQCNTIKLNQTRAMNIIEKCRARLDEIATVKE